jgi:APA family basic amino acid/polyamine antiporter
VAHLPFGTTFLIPWVGLLAAILLFVASNAGMVGASRLAYNMGEYYQLPGYFYRVHAKFRTPFVALAVFALLAILVVVASRGRMAFLADLYNFGAMLGFFFAHLSLIVLRIKKPDLKRPVKLPLNIPLGRNRSLPISAIVGCLATASVWVLIVVTKSEGRYLGLAWMLFGVLMYLFYRRKKKMHPIGHMMVERVTVPESERFDVKNILVAIRGGEHTETVQMASEQAKLHGAKLTAITILEVPPSLPLDAALPFRVELLKETLKRAEAIARDFDIPIELKLIRSRSIEGGIFDVLKEGSYDLLVIGSLQLHPSHHKYGLGKITEHILRKAPCRVLLCSPARK